MDQPNNHSVYQKLPQKPKFGLIVLLSGIAILVLFLCAYVFLKSDGRKMMPNPQHKANPNASIFRAHLDTLAT